ncbi:MAG: integrase arm-type DNA-binding domain-containing protein [Gammaproteobacteria bacterium]
MPLTDTRIRSLKPSEKPYRLADGGGLGLEVKTTGSRLWRYRYRLAGKENVFAIGAYPEVSLKEARIARDDARKLVKEGLHPAQQRKADRLRAAHENANTFKAVAMEWLEANKNHWTPRTYLQRKRLLERDVFPSIGTLPMRDVTSADGHAILQRIEARAPQMAVIAKQSIGAISRLAMVTMRADTDIAYPLRNVVRTAPVQHKSPLRPNEIPKFFAALDQYAGYFPTKAAIRLLWFTLARPTEVLEARWDEFDLDSAIWTIPAGRMKMRRSHTFPLPAQAIELLRVLQGISGSFPYLVPNRNDPRRHATRSVLIKAFGSMGYTGKFSPHGIRVTGRTILGEQGHPRDVLERQLAHQDAKHVRAYDQGDRLEARRVVMQQWADYLDGLRAGADVVSLNKSRRG